MKIAVDLDDVIAKLHEKLVDFYNHKYDTSFSDTDFKSFHLSETWEISPQKAMEEVLLFYESKFFDEIDPIEGSQEILNIISKDHSLSIITSRPEEIRSKTESWLEQYFPKVFSEVYFTNGMTRDLSKKIKKSEVCKKISAEVFIDDAHHNALDCATAVDKVFLMHQPWNEIYEDLPKKISRVKNWNEVLARLS